MNQRKDQNNEALSTGLPGTSIDFALKIIALLVGKTKATEVASQLVLAAGIYDYQH